MEVLGKLDQLANLFGVDVTGGVGFRRVELAPVGVEVVGIVLPLRPKDERQGLKG
jgi:hypothetical protein